MTPRKPNVYLLLGALSLLLFACVSREQREVPEQKKEECTLFYIPLEKVEKKKELLTLVNHYLDQAPEDSILLSLTNAFLIQLLNEKGYTIIPVTGQQQTVRKDSTKGCVVQPDLLGFTEQKHTQSGTRTLFPDHDVFCSVTGKIWSLRKNEGEAVVIEFFGTGRGPVVNGKSAAAFYSILNQRYQPGTAYDYTLHKHDYLPFYELCWQAAITNANNIDRIVKKNICLKTGN